MHSEVWKAKLFINRWIPCNNDLNAKENEVIALNNVILIFIAFKHVYKDCITVKEKKNRNEKAVSITMFGFEIKIMDKCCVCGKQMDQ